jgi:hypothetical protein
VLLFQIILIFKKDKQYHEKVFNSFSRPVGHDRSYRLREEGSKGGRADGTGHGARRASYQRSAKTG